MMKRDLYKEAISLEKDALGTKEYDAKVTLKKDKPHHVGIYVTIVAAAAVLILVLLTVFPSPDLRELNQADRLIAKIDINIQPKIYSFNAGQNTIDKFNQRLLEINRDGSRDLNLVGKFNAMIDKYERNN